VEIQDCVNSRSLTREADYFTKVLEDDLKAVTKPQYVDQIPKAVKGTNRTVGFQMEQRCQVEKERLDEIAEVLGKFDRMTPRDFVLILRRRTQASLGSRCGSSFWRRVTAIRHCHGVRPESRRVSADSLRNGTKTLMLNLA
jgi:hypothetical protein